MSMRNFGCTGHVVKLAELLALLPPVTAETISEIIGDRDTEEITSLVNKNLPANYPKVESVFILSDEDESEDLERGEWYAYFAMEDLFVQTPTAQMVALTSAGINPERKNWVVWG